MEMSEALTLWESLGNTWASWDAKNAYYTLFINKEGDVVGHIKTVPGMISWEWPIELLALKEEKV